MPTFNSDLHGNVPDTSPVVLLLIDVINDLEFEDGDKLLKHALPMASRLAALKARARKHKIPSIYINDNFGRWQSDFNKQLSHCLEDGTRGEKIVERLQPADDDYFVLKPKHSGFFSSTLDTLLQYLKAHTLIITGLAGNIGVLFTANDAYMRDYRIHVPKDCVASNTTVENNHALQIMDKVLKVDLTPSTELDLAALIHRSSTAADCAPKQGKRTKRTLEKSR